MAETVGGGQIVKYEFTRSFGAEPASASGQAVIPGSGGDLGLSVGDYVVYAFGGILFYGVMSSVTLRTEREDGQAYDFQVVDNRVRLPWQIFFGCYNIQEPTDVIFERPLLKPPSGEFTSGGLTGSDGVSFSAAVGSLPAVQNGDIDDPSTNRGRLFSHIVPSQWRSQARSYTTAPVSAADILRSAFKGSRGGFNFSLDLHPDQNNPVMGIDANGGMTLAALVSTLCEQQGLQVTLDGARTLRFERRGEGTLVIPPPPAHVVSDGLAMSADPTKVAIVGDRTLVQVNNINLEPDWKSGWEKFLSEPLWLSEVATKFELDPSSPGGRAEIAARAREITLREYIAKAGGGGADLVDTGRLGKTSRMNLPVWTYINSIVFRSYRIPRDRQLYGLPMCGLEIHETLLAGVQLDDPANGQIHYRTAPVELYPQGGAFAIAKGQPLDLLAASERESVIRRTSNMRETWSEVGDFTLDAANASIRFASPVFIDGDPDQGQSILLYPNQGQGNYSPVSGLDDDSDYFGVVVPNPDYQISAAEVKVALVFRLGKFYKEYGSGARFGIQNTDSIAEHLLDTTDAGSIDHAKVAGYSGTLAVPSAPGSLKEILYEDGSSALSKADLQAQAAIRKSGTERSGSYKRYGAAGTAVSGVIDRVTVRVTFGGGIEEEVEFSKPRVSSAFVSSRDFAQRARSGDLFEGQSDLRREVRQYRGIGRMERLGINDATRSPSHVKLSDILNRPMGAENASVVHYHDANSQAPSDHPWRAGDIVWLDKQGLPSRTGNTFGGVVVASPGSGGDAPKIITAAIRGVVPVAVKADTQPGHSVSATPGDWNAKGGPHSIGVIAHHGAVPGDGDSTLALVRLGADAPTKCRFAVWISPEKGRLYVGPGTVAVSNDAHPDVVTRPFFPTLDGTSVETSPYFDIGSKTDGELYEVLCVYDWSSQTGKIKLQKKSEGLSLSGCERAICIADFTLKTVAGKKQFDQFTQRVASDIGRAMDEFSCSGSDSSDSGGGSSGHSGDSDHSSGDPDSSGDSSSNDSSDSFGPDAPQSGCCQNVAVFQAYFYGIGDKVSGGTRPGENPDTDAPDWPTDDSYLNSTDPQWTVMALSIHLDPVNGGADSPCSGRLWMDVYFLGQKKSFYLGQSLSLDKQVFFVGPTRACQGLFVHYCLTSFGAGAPLTGIADQNCCFTKSANYITPAVAGEPPCHI